MSTRSSVWYGEDSKGRVLHIYWELGERIPRVAAPVYMEVISDGKEARFRLPKELAEQVLAALGDPMSLKIM